jgi:hypothetical protein
MRPLWWLALSGAVIWAAFPAMAAPAGPQAAPTPTVDRLAAPPTVTNPTQADIGAQLFWQNCQPCHGDRAQGLTDEWRAQYPPEDQNCWKGGCHGDRPYQNGFTLPHTVPALVGPGTLSRFATAADLYAFVSHAMPFQAPGSLKPAEYWAIIGFLLRGHGVLAGDQPITDAAGAQHIPLGPPATATAMAAATPGRGGVTPPLLGLPATAALLAIAGLVLVGGGWWVWRQMRRP